MEPTGQPLRFERWLRWTFAGFLVLFFAAGIFRLRTVFPSFLPSRPGCEVRFTSDVEEQAEINLGPLGPVRTLRAAFREARLACRRDTSLQQVNVRVRCPRGDGWTPSISRLVFCK